jgi:hypothetical protein
MKARNSMLSLLLLSAVCVTPAYANYFSDGRTGVTLNVGSAPSPTPEQLRAIGDSYYGREYYREYRERRPPPRSARYGEVRPGLGFMEGRMVFGDRGQRLGYVLAVDDRTNQIELQTRSGIGVVMSANLIVERDGRLMAPTTSSLDVMSMAKAQTGRTIALNVDLTREGG